MMCARWVLVAVLLIACVAGVQGTNAEVSPKPPEVGIVEQPGGLLPLDLEFMDEEGNLTPLRSVIKGPVIVTFVYYRCPGICSPLLTEVTRVVRKLDLEPGKDYTILTVSFDHREKPEIARDKRTGYLAAVEKPINPAGWRFFTGDSASIRALTSAAGFYFKRDGEDWIHAGALIILSPEGKITRYINGVRYLPFDVKMALIEASNGTVSPTIATVLKFCYSYDPEGRTYALNVTRIALVGTLLLVGVFALVFIVRPRIRNVRRDGTNDKAV
jgi:protein SCO1/2